MYQRLPDQRIRRFSLDGRKRTWVLPRLAAALEAVPAGTELHVHIEHLDYIDHACMELLSSWEERDEKAGGSLQVEWHELVDRYQRKKNQTTAERLPSHGAAMAAMGRS